jgi:AraC family transcriptional regulator
MIAEVAPARRHVGGLHAFIAGLAPGTRLDGHRHDQPTLVLVVRGAVQVTEGREEFRDTPGVLCLCPPGLSRSIGSDATAEGTECLVITCGARHPVARHAIWKSVGPDRGARYRLGDQGRDLLDAVQGPGGCGSALEATCLALLTELHARGDSCGAAPPWLAQALRALSQSGGRSGACRAVAREIGIHSVHLARVVKRHTGLTVRDYVRSDRVAIAARLLVTTRLPLARIALLSGFADQSHFTREFARRVGHPPSRHPRMARDDVASVQAVDVPGVYLGRVTHSDDLDDPSADGESGQPPSP